MTTDFTFDPATLPPEIQAFQLNAQAITDRVVAAMRAEQDRWFEAAARRHFPAFIVKAVIEGKYLRLCSRWIERNGYDYARWPDGRIEFRRHEQVLETYQPWPIWHHPN